MMTALLVLMASSVLAGEAVPEKDKKPPEPQAVIAGWEALTSPAEARGLYDKAVLEWLEAARKNPKSPGAELALRRIPELRGKLTVLGSKPVLEALRELAAVKDAPVAAALARELLVEQLRDAGQTKEADEAAAGLGLIENWMMIGAFGRHIAATHDRVFEPEQKIDLAAEYDPGRYYYVEKNKWRALPTNGRGERLEPYDYLRPEGGACYLLAQVESDKERRNCALLIKTPAAFKVWLNDRLVRDGDRYRQNLPREVETPLALAAGWNRLLIKLSAPATVSARLAEDGNPLTLVTEKKEGLHPLPAAQPELAPVPVGGLTGAAERPAASLAAPGVLRRLENLDDEAIRLLKVAVEREPTRAAWHWHLAEAYHSAEYLSAPARKNLAAAEYAAALKCDPGFVPARLRLAEAFAAEGHEEQALTELKAALVASPECAQIPLEMAMIARRLGWRNETRAWLDETRKVAAELPARRLLAAEFHRDNGNLDLAMEEYRELCKALPGSGSCRGLLARTLADRGEWKEAVKLREAGVKARPNDPQPHAELARCLEASGDFKKAAEVWRDLGGLVPGEAAYRRALGEALAKGGDAAGARKAYAEALELDPGDHRLRRLVERQSGIDEDFSAAVALDIFKEIETSRKRSYERANAVRVLDQTVVRVYPDGSASEFIADGERILTDKAVEKLSEIPVFGEVAEARTIGKDGSIHEPTVIPGERRLTMPGLEPDATVEYKYRRDQPAREWGGFYLDKWYFRSPQLDEPHQVSDYIVMIPKGMAHKVVRHNFDVAERVEEKEGLIVYRWTARDRARVDAEPHMEHFDHFLPFVEIGTERSWQDVADSFKSLYLGRTRPTGALREAAGKAVEGKKTAAEKARALYELVAERVRHRTGQANAHQVLASGSGDPEMLYLALAEDAGLEAFQGRANKAPEFQESDDEPPSWEMPDEDLFRAEVVGVRLEDGRIQWMDLSSRYMPFGAVRQELEGARVLAVGRGAAFFDRLPRSGLDAAGTALAGELELDAAGNLKGKLREHTFGAPAAAVKEQLGGLDAAACRTLVQGELEAMFRGASLVEMDMFGVNEPGSPLVTACRFERGAWLQAGPAGRLTCPPGIKPQRLVPDLAMDPSRKFPLKIAEPRVLRESLRFRLPPELEIAGLPAEAVVSGPFGTYSLVFERTADGFSVDRRMILPAQTVAPGDYEKFVAFCKRVDEAEKAQVALRRREAGGEKK
jgi:tetratricopeptide (TPR) repeat protein